MKKNYVSLTFTLVVIVLLISCSKANFNNNEIAATEKVSELSTTSAQNQTSDEEVEGNIIFTQVVKLEGSQEVATPSAPAVATETKGIAILRVSASKKLYSKIIIQKLAEGDVLRFSHVHVGAAGINGPISFNLADSPADFGVNKELQLTDAQFTLITTGACYVNVHSNFRPAGIIRGQIR